MSESSFVDISLTLFIIITILTVVLPKLCNCDSDQTNKEQFRNYGNLDNYSSKTHAERIKAVNDRRCNEGRFYVNCHSCGRERVEKELYGTKNCGCKCGKSARQRFCVEGCEKTVGDTMRFYNENYVNKDHIFCYNCLTDRYIPPDGVSKTPFARNYIYWPTLNDPNNGVPSSSYWL